MGRIIKPSFFSSNREAYECRFDWPGNCFVQCGGDGIVFTGEKGLQEAFANPLEVVATTLAPEEIAQASPLKHYRTAFFEAFPRNPNTFIRGEGVTIAAAEEATWDKFQKIIACPGHEFEARGYENGGGFCRHCNMFQSDVIAPHIPCVGCGMPTWWSRDINGDMWCAECEVPEELMTEDSKWLKEHIARSRAAMELDDKAITQALQAIFEGFEGESDNAQIPELHSSGSSDNGTAG
ncbi:MAG: hypothetical protein KA314_04930 [Chloroflexi bacterium]|nr:hypothetical protein [Chloroflexota bacterium]